MTLWVCIGVYVVGMSATPFILSFVYGKPWAKGDDFCMFITMLLWPVFLLLLSLHAWACFMSKVGVTLSKRVKRVLDALKEACDG